MSNDTVNVQRGIAGKGSGDDLYILAESLIDANAQITISDVEGSNAIQLIGGLSILSSILAGDTAQLTLSNGATVTILGASTMEYSIGGNPLTGEEGSVKTYQTFASDILGITVPSSGTSNGGISEINSDGTAEITPVTDTTSLLTQAQAKSNTILTYGAIPVQGDSPAVESGSYWSKINITYSFNETEPADYEGEGVVGFIAFPEVAKAPTRIVFDDAGEFLGVTFTEVSSDGDIRMNAVTQPENVDGYASYPDGTAYGGDIFLNKEYTTEEQYMTAGSPVFTIIHELGHAMGLKHTFEGDVTLIGEEANTQYSVMSYTEVNTQSLSFTLEDGSIYETAVEDHFNTGFSYYDVLGLQGVYGVNTTHNDTDTTYIINFSNTVQKVIWDAGGTDTIDGSTATGICTVDLRESKYSSIDVRSASDQAAAKVTEMGITDSDFITYINEQYADLSSQKKLFTGENNLVIGKGVWVENVLTGNANDIVQDNSVDNNIMTGVGDDIILLTEGGFDTVAGGAGTDQVQFNVASTAATVELQSDGSYIVLGDSFAAQLTGIEVLKFTDISTDLI